MRGRAPTREERWVALGLWVLAFAVLWATEAAVGFTRDESVYFYAGERYAEWFRLLFHSPVQALRDESIVRAFDYNREHPVLMKVLFGLSHLLFHQQLAWLRPATAFRVPAFAVAALVPALTYLLGSALYGRVAGLFAAVAFFVVPRHFFHSHLACFDVPVAALWLLVVYCFWRALEDMRWGVGCGVAWGLALATKHNALFLPLVLLPFALWRAWTASASRPLARAWVVRSVGLVLGVAALYGLMVLSLGPERFRQSFLLLSPHTVLFVGLGVGLGQVLRALRHESEPAARALLPLVAMAVLGPVLFYAHWPYLWHAPVERTAWYLAFHARHEHYTWFYLGELLRAPPFPLEYVVVKTALTVPASLLAPMVTGLGVLAARAVAAGWERARAWVRPLSLAEALVGANALASILIISHPQVPHFGGVKHWLPSMPFLCVLAGAAVARGCEALLERLRGAGGPAVRAAVVATVCALLVAPALVGLWRVFPYGTAFYAELAGGLPGAASLGMQRQFWSSHVTGVLPWINEHAPRGARVYLHEVHGLSFRDYQRNGLLREDLQPVGPAEADIAAYQYHQEFREHELNVWQAFGTQVPTTGLYVDETPQVIVYQRR
jgi:4-amino-4-deoxy-L-arabinose transferase-like glycosyltransferase